jgi:hypothetical protein
MSRMSVALYAGKWTLIYFEHFLGVTSLQSKTNNYNRTPFIRINSDGEPS